MAIRLAVRGYSGRTLIFHDRIEVERAEQLDPIAETQIKRLLDFPKHMVEIEFLDEPDVNHRFFRFGTDPSGMVKPIAIRGRNDQPPEAGQ